MIWGDSLEIMNLMPDDSFHLVLADPPYGDPVLINRSIMEARRVSSGASLYFMYAEDLVNLIEPPDQVCFWVKPTSTKNTSRRYSRFVEVIACYDLARSPFRQDTHWTTRSGIFTDTLVTQDHPYKKPESLIEKLLVVNTNVGDRVLDPFAGSGTVETVCNRIGRHCLSIDVDKGYAKRGSAL
jgi:DNA modification methylase